MNPTGVIFIRGLNTYGDDDLHLGPLDFGPMHAPLAQTLRNYGVELIALEGFGWGPLSEQIARAHQILLSLPQWKNTSAHFHLLGHSTGGLIGRGLLKREQGNGRFKSLVTLGTPHQGTPMALWALSFHQRHPLLYRSLKATGYDTRKKLAAFQDLTPEALQIFNQSHIEPKDVALASPQFVVPLKQMSWPLRTLCSLSGLKTLPSDGLIAASSQAWGQSLGKFQLDHVNQLGFHPYWIQARQKKCRTEFIRLCEVLAKFWSLRYSEVEPKALK